MMDDINEREQKRFASCCGPFFYPENGWLLSDGVHHVKEYCILQLIHLLYTCAAHHSKSSLTANEYVKIAMKSLQDNNKALATRYDLIGPINSAFERNETYFPCAKYFTSIKDTKKIPHVDYPGPPLGDLVYCTSQTDEKQRFSIFSDNLDINKSILIPKRENHKLVLHHITKDDITDNFMTTIPRYARCMASYIFNGASIQERQKVLTGTINDAIDYVKSKQNTTSPFYRAFDKICNCTDIKLLEQMFTISRLHYKTITLGVIQLKLNLVEVNLREIAEDEILVSTYPPNPIGGNEPILKVILKYNGVEIPGFFVDGDLIKDKKLRYLEVVSSKTTFYSNKLNKALQCMISETSDEKYDEYDVCSRVCAHLQKATINDFEFTESSIYMSLSDTVVPVATRAAGGGAEAAGGGAEDASYSFQIIENAFDSVRTATDMSMAIDTVYKELYSRPNANNKRINVKAQVENKLEKRWTALSQCIWRRIWELTIDNQFTGNDSASIAYTQFVTQLRISANIITVGSYQIDENERGMYRNYHCLGKTSTMPEGFKSICKEIIAKYHVQKEHVDIFFSESDYELSKIYNTLEGAEKSIYSDRFGNVERETRVSHITFLNKIVVYLASAFSRIFIERYTQLALNHMQQSGIDVVEEEYDEDKIMNHIESYRVNDLSILCFIVLTDAKIIKNIPDLDDFYTYASLFFNNIGQLIIELRKIEDSMKILLSGVRLWCFKNRITTSTIKTMGLVITRKFDYPFIMGYQGDKTKKPQSDNILEGLIYHIKQILIYVCSKKLDASQKDRITNAISTQGSNGEEDQSPESDSEEDQSPESDSEEDQPPEVEGSTIEEGQSPEVEGSTIEEGQPSAAVHPALLELSSDSSSDSDD